MKNDNLYITDNARNRLIAGINKCADAVGGTMGTGGANALIEAIENPGHLATNDGATILSSIKLADPIEDMGRKILLESVSRANKQSGDGSSTTTVLTAAIINAGSQSEFKDAMRIKREMEACIPLIEESIKSQSKVIDVSDVAKVATISAEDASIGALIQEIYEQIGKDGIIHWDISKTTEDTYTIGNGITIEGAGFISPYMCDFDEKSGQLTNQARWTNPKVLITNQKITSASDFGTLFATLNNQNHKEVVIFCNEIEATVIPDLIQTRIVRGFKTIVIKMPILWQDQWYEDIALASGATIIDPSAGLTFKNMTPEHLGQFGNIVVSKDDTFIDGIKDLSEHIAKLKEENTDDSNLRASRLNTKTARLYVGAHSDSALSYKRLKVEDAISAAWQALQHGVVAGGGIALINAAESLPNTEGGLILKNALWEPFFRIMKNAGLSTNVEVGGEQGINSLTGEVVNMFEANIIDPTSVEINACKNAISVASTILTANTVLVLPREDKDMGKPDIVR